MFRTKFTFFRRSEPSQAKPRFEAIRLNAVCSGTYSLNYLFPYLGFIRFILVKSLSTESFHSHVASIYANLLERKKRVRKEFNSHRTGLGH